jgi:lipoprotein NlpD
MVRRGDTLYSIALDHGLDYRELAAWNELADPNVIQADQRLRLRAPPGWKPPPEPAAEEEVVARPLTAAPQIEAKALEAPPALITAPKGLKVAFTEQALAELRGEPVKPPVAKPARPAESPRPSAAEKPAAVASAGAARPRATPPSGGPAPTGTAAKDAAPAPGESQWIWPARGRLLHGFSEGPNPKGVAIAGDAGQPVFASASGKVVYSGSGLRGYGKLIIIKHSDTYLSVYAHNRALLVKEGERVARGQKIAEMGDSDSDRVALHFEIRRLGKPVDPLRYLPEGGAS